MKRLNWVDILIIVILVAALVFVGCKKLIPKSTEENVEEQIEERNPLTEPTLKFVVEVTEVSRELAENAIATFDDEPRELDGDEVYMTRLYNSNRLVDAQIVEWEIKDTEDEDLVTARFTIEANPTIYRCNYVVGTQEARIGKSFIVKTMSMELTGIIVSVTELDHE